MGKKPVFLLTGPPHTGKTTFLQNMVSEMDRIHLPYTGWSAPLNLVIKGSVGYDLSFFGTQGTLPLCRTVKTAGWTEIKRFWFNPQAIESGNTFLLEASAIPGTLLIIDEIGPFELEGKVWGPLLDTLCSASTNPLLLVVREKLLSEVIRKWMLDVREILKPGEKEAGIWVRSLSKHFLP